MTKKKAQMLVDILHLADAAVEDGVEHILVAVALDGVFAPDVVVAEIVGVHGLQPGDHLMKDGAHGLADVLRFKNLPRFLRFPPTGVEQQKWREGQDHQRAGQQEQQDDLQPVDPVRHGNLFLFHHHCLLCHK